MVMVYICIGDGFDSSVLIYVISYFSSFDEINKLFKILILRIVCGY